MKIAAGIVGATGYTGLELIRLLNQHPWATVGRVFSSSQAGRSIADIYPHLSGVCELVLEQFDPAAKFSGIEVLFLALPHGQTHQFLPGLVAANPTLKIVDLSADFRISDPEIYSRYYQHPHQSPAYLKDVVFGIPELYREKIKRAAVVANPGCYALTTILGLLPLAKAGHLEGEVVFVDAKSGVSGAGRGLKESSLFCEAYGAISAYGTVKHRHTAEICQELKHAQLVFSPHLLPQSRGILASCYVRNRHRLNQQQVLSLYKEFYLNEPFVSIFGQNASPTTKAVVGSNRCAIFPNVFDENVVVFSATDNLIKGASGQAIQNMNLMFGFEEALGLPKVANYL